MPYLINKCQNYNIDLINQAKTMKKYLQIVFISFKTIWMACLFPLSSLNFTLSLYSILQFGRDYFLQ